MFALTNGYLTITGLENVTYYGIKSLYQILEAGSVVYLAKDSVTLTVPYYVK